jgi:GxxExxY protein
MVKDADVLKLCDQVRQVAFDLHTYLKDGHLEKVYDNGLAHRLRKRGIKVLQQHPLSVYDEDGTVLGDYYADQFVEDSIVVELKACRSLIDGHAAQILGYLRASRQRHGLLINFGSPVIQIKKFVL